MSPNTIIADGILAEERLAHHKALCRIGVALGIWVHGPSEPVNVDRLVDRILSLRGAAERLDHAIEEPRRLVHADPLTGQRVNADPGTFNHTTGLSDPRFDGVIAHIDDKYLLVAAEDGSLIECHRDGIRLLDPAEAVAALRGEPRPVRPVSASVSEAPSARAKMPEPKAGMVVRAGALPERGSRTVDHFQGAHLIEFKEGDYVTRAEWDALDPDDIIEPPAPASDPLYYDEDIPL